MAIHNEPIPVSPLAAAGGSTSSSCCKLGRTAADNPGADEALGGVDESCSASADPAAARAEVEVSCDTSAASGDHGGLSSSHGTGGDDASGPMQLPGGEIEELTGWVDEVLRHEDRLTRKVGIRHAVNTSLTSQKQVCRSQTLSEFFSFVHLLGTIGVTRHCVHSATGFFSGPLLHGVHCNCSKTKLICGFGSFCSGVAAAVTLMGHKHCQMPFCSVLSLLLHSSLEPAVSSHIVIHEIPFQVHKYNQKYECPAFRVPNKTFRVTKTCDKRQYVHDKHVKTKICDNLVSTILTGRRCSTCRDQPRPPISSFLPMQRGGLFCHVAIQDAIMRIHLLGSAKVYPALV